jgi:hypothetical protein
MKKVIAGFLVSFFISAAIASTPNVAVASDDCGDEYRDCLNQALLIYNTGGDGDELYNDAAWCDVDFAACSGASIF